MNSRRGFLQSLLRGAAAAAAAPFIGVVKAYDPDLADNMTIKVGWLRKDEWVLLDEVVIRAARKILEKREEGFEDGHEA